MHVIQRFYHAPSGSAFKVCILTSQEMKNRAFALLYRKYIATAKAPWDFPEENPSKIRVEMRTVDGMNNVPTLVDDFEHTAVLCGIISETDGALIGTFRMLRRIDMPDEKLEVERYDTFSSELRQKLKDEQCDLEFNRLAIDTGLARMKSALISMFVVFFGEVEGAKSNVKGVITISQGFLKHAEGQISRSMRKRCFGSFKYAATDPAPVVVLILSWQDSFFASFAYALRGGTLLYPEFKKLDIYFCGLLMLVLVVLLMPSMRLIQLLLHCIHLHVPFYMLVSWM